LLNDGLKYCYITINIQYLVLLNLDMILGLGGEQGTGNGQW